MKNLIVFFFLFFVPHLLRAQGNLGLVAHWNFNGNVADSSGNGLHGSNFGAIPANGFTGAANKAMYFKGLDTPNNTYSHVFVPYTPLMNVTNYSLCALLKPTGFNTNTCQVSCIFNRGFHTGTQVSQDMILFEMGDNFYDGDCNTFSPTHFYFQSTPITSYIPGSTELYPQPVQLNTWYCVVASFDGDSVRMYINGSLVKTVFRQTVMQPTSEGLSIGMSYDYVINSVWPFPFIGYIDDMRWYNRKLTAAEANVYCDSAKMSTTTAVESISNKEKIAVYPNPAKDNITIEVSGKNDEEVYYSVTNVGGQVVLKNKRLTGNKANISLSSYPAGLYLVLVSIDGEIVVKTVLKE